MFELEYETHDLECNSDDLRLNQLKQSSSTKPSTIVLHTLHTCEQDIPKNDPIAHHILVSEENGPCLGIMFRDHV